MQFTVIAAVLVVHALCVVTAEPDTLVPQNADIEQDLTKCFYDESDPWGPCDQTSKVQNKTLHLKAGRSWCPPSKIVHQGCFPHLSSQEPVYGKTMSNRNIDHKPKPSSVEDEIRQSITSAFERYSRDEGITKELERKTNPSRNFKDDISKQFEESQRVNYHRYGRKFNGKQGRAFLTTSSQQTEVPRYCYHLIHKIERRFGKNPNFAGLQGMHRGRWFLQRIKKYIKCKELVGKANMITG